MAATDKRRLSRKRPQRAPRDTPDVAAGVRRMVLALGRRIGTEDPEQLAELAELEAAVAEAWWLAVDGLRETGYSDAAIGRQLGMTRQAVAQRWPRSRRRITSRRRRDGETS